MKRFTNSSRMRGQGMTEYIIITALIAVAAIGTYSWFGKTVRSQTGAMAAALGGDQAGANTSNTAAKAGATAAATAGKSVKNLNDFGKDSLSN